MSESHHSIGWPVWGLTTAFLALAGALAIHQHTLGAFFFEDDVQWIIGGLTWPLSWLLSLEGRSHFYRPVIELYFIVQTRVWGTSPESTAALSAIEKSASSKRKCDSSRRSIRIISPIIAPRSQANL